MKSSGVFLNDFNAGHFVISKIQWVVSVVILLKLWKCPAWAYLASIPLTIILTWLIGYVIVRIGLWDNFIREQLKGIK